MSFRRRNTGNLYTKFFEVVWVFRHSWGSCRNAYVPINYNLPVEERRELKLMKKQLYYENKPVTNYNNIFDYL